EGESIQYADISCGNPNKWEWTFEGGTPATSTQKNPNILYSTPGNYMVTLVATNDDGSSEESTMQIRVVSETESSVGESKENLDLFVYPNPTSDRLEIRNLENSIYNVSIYDNLGNVVFSGTVTNGNSVVSLESFYTGVYHLRVTNNDGVFYSKVIKK
ncbi:MAG: T9SS type A sorting domain-containing protein, partial [Candidatus Kapaibacterium sp.]